VRTLKIDPSSSTPIFQQIVNYYEELIITGVLHEGDFIKSVRELSIDIGINPNTISKAYLLLQQKGLVNSERGRGLVVNKIGSRDADSKKSELLNLKVDELIDLSKKLHVKDSELISKVKERLK